MKKIIWTYEKCKEEASKYSSRNEFREGDYKAYQAAWKNGWLDEFYGEKFFWTYKRCKEEAQKYSSRSEFSRGNSNAYKAALRNHWLDEWFKERFVWTYEKCREEAQKYSSRGEFSRGNQSAYNAARKNNWLDFLFKENNSTNYYIYSYEFSAEKAVYVGRTVLPPKRDIEHRVMSNDIITIFAKNHNTPIPKMKILEEGISTKEGNIKEDEWLKKYKESGWTILNITKNGSLTK